MGRLSRLNYRGDTIVEVLLAITVMSMVLSVSYGLANRSSQTNRQAQERGEAQKTSEEQLELLRGYVSPDKPWGDNICFKDDSTPTDVAEDCQARGPFGRYNIKISVAGNATKGYTYTIDTNWDNVRGGTDKLALSYKLPATGDIAASTGFGPNTPPQPPQITVLVKKVPPAAGNTTPACGTGTQNKSGIPTTVDGSGQTYSGTTDGNSLSTFPGLEFDKDYTASFTVPSGFEACGSTTSSIRTDFTANANYTAPFVIRPICTGNLTTVPVYGWVNVLVGWNTGYTVGGYIKSYRYTTGGFPLGYGPTLVAYGAGNQEGLPANVPLYRWANGNPAANPAGNLYDFYWANYYANPIYQAQYLQTGSTTIDTRACPS